MRGASSGSATVNSSRSTAVAPPISRSTSGAVEQHPAAVELGEAGREGPRDPHALVAEARPPLAEAEGDQAQDLARRLAAEPVAPGPCPARRTGMPSGVRPELLGGRRELAAARIDAAQHHLQPLRPPWRWRAIPGRRRRGRAAARRGWPAAPCASAGGDGPAVAADRVGDHRGVAPHQLVLEVLAIAGHQGHGDDHGDHPEGGREQRRPRRAVEQPAAPPAQEPPGDHPGEGAGEEVELAGSGGALTSASSRRGSGRRGTRRRAARARPPGGTAPTRPACPSTANPSTVPSFRFTWVTAQEAGQRGGIDGEAVVLAGDRHLARRQVAHRLVAAVVAELELEGAAAQGEAEELVPQADAEDRQLGREQLADVLDDPGQRLRIARAVRQHDAVDPAAPARRSPACGPAARSAARRARRASAGCWSSPRSRRPRGGAAPPPPPAIS